MLRSRGMSIGRVVRARILTSTLVDRALTRQQDDKYSRSHRRRSLNLVLPKTYTSSIFDHRIQTPW